MIKVLIVDDEPLVRNFLRTLICWEEQGYEICAEATNGRTAINMINEHKPDIVILDISMPTMDGVALSTYIYENSLALKVIILSSYQDYSYVRTTMKNGAVDYLLKHEITCETLLQALKRAEKSIRDKPVRDEASVHAGKLLMRESIKKILLNLETPSTEIAPQLAGVVAVMQIVGYNAVCERFTVDARFRLEQSLLNISETILSDSEGGLIIPMDQGRYAIILPITEERSEANIKSSVGAIMSIFESAMGKYLNLSLIWVHGAVCTSALQLSQSYFTACALLDGGAGSVNRNGAASRIRLTTFQEKSLLTALDAVNATATRAILDDIFSAFSGCENNPSTAKLAVSELITIATKICIREQINFDSLCNMGMLHFNLMDDARKWTISLYDKLISKLAEKHPASAYHPYVARAIEYIHKRYAQNFSLSTMSDDLFISAPYLSRLFKEQTGKSFVDYLRAFRVRKAIELMNEGKYSISVISNMVGFKNYNYFFQVFKEVTGQTPKNYGHYYMKEIMENERKQASHITD